MTTSVRFGPLTRGDVINLATIVTASFNSNRVTRLLPKDYEFGGGLIAEGTARSIGDKDGNFAGSDEDVRDCYLRVTTSTGFEAFWPVSELMDEVASGYFVVTS
jgi:hypothetical protein